MTRVRSIALLALMFVLVVPTFCQATDTPTVTPTQTPTVTHTPTPTPQSNALNVVFRQTCSSPPCTFSLDVSGYDRSVLGKGDGHKTCAVAISGTATVQCLCCVAGTEVCAQLGTDLSASGVRESDMWCDVAQVKVTACTGCLVSGWFRVAR